ARSAAIIAAALGLAGLLVTVAGGVVYRVGPSGPPPPAGVELQRLSAADTALNLSRVVPPRDMRAARETEYQGEDARPRPGVVRASPDQKLPEPAYLVEQFPGGKVHRLLWETTIGRDKDSHTQIS